MTQNGGTTWTSARGARRADDRRRDVPVREPSGPSARSPGFSGYPQPTLVAFDPLDPDILVAGGADSGVFLSTNGGTRWQLVTDPITPGASGMPHIPRPYYAHFDHDPPGRRHQSLSRHARPRRVAPDVHEGGDAGDPGAVAAVLCARVRRCQGDRTLNVCNTSAGNLIVSGDHLVESRFHRRRAVGGIPGQHQPRLLLPVPGRVHADVARAQDARTSPSRATIRAFPSLRRCGKRQRRRPDRGDGHRRHRQLRRAVRRVREVPGSAAHDQQQRRLPADRHRHLVLVAASSRWPRC